LFHLLEREREKEKAVFAKEAVPWNTT